MEVIGMKVKGSWRDVADAARTTVRKEAGNGEPCLQLEMDRHSLLGVSAFRPAQVRRRTLGQHAAYGSHRRGSHEENSGCSCRA